MHMVAFMTQIVTKGMSLSRIASLNANARPLEQLEAKYFMHTIFGLHSSYIERQAYRRVPPVLFRNSTEPITHLNGR